jgi:hypothetical protein
METSSTHSSTRYYSSGYKNPLHWLILIIIIPLEALGKIIIYIGLSFVLTDIFEVIADYRNPLSSE